MKRLIGVIFHPTKNNKILKSLLLLTVTFFVGGFFVVNLATAIESLTLYVDKGESSDDSDGNNCLSPGAPCATIQAAIKRANDGDTIEVGAGTYVEVGQIVIDKDLTIVGKDKETTIIKPAQNTPSTHLSKNSGWILVKSGSELNLSNVTLDGDDKTVIYGIHCNYGCSGTIKNNVIKNIKSSRYVGLGVALQGSMTISNNRFENIERVGVWVAATHAKEENKENENKSSIIVGNTYLGKGEGDYLDYGIEIGRGAGAKITDNTISNCQGIATSDGSGSGAILVTDYYGQGSEADVTGNTLTNNLYGLSVGYLDTDESKVTATKNNFVQNSTQVRVKDATVFDFESTLANNTFDRATVVRYNDGEIKVLTIFSNINDAMEKAGFDDVVEVLSGTYEENVNLEKQGIILKSRDGVSNTIIKGDTISFKANNVTLEGFTVDNNGGDRAVCPRNTDGSSVKDNIIKNSFRGVQGDWHGEPTNLTITGNRFETNYGIAGTEGMTGLTVENNVFNTTEEGIGIGNRIGISLMKGNQFSGTEVYVKDYRDSFDLNELEDIFRNNIFPGNAAIVENAIVLVIPAPTLPGGGGPINFKPPTTGGSGTEGEEGETEGEVLGETDSRDYKEQEEEKKAKLEDLRGNKDRLGRMKDIINGLLENIEDEEKENLLREILERLNEIEENLDKEIEEYEKSLEEIIEKRVLSEQKERAEKAEDAVNKLLDEGDLTEEQRNSLEDLLERLQEIRIGIEERLNQ